MTTIRAQFILKKREDYSTDLKNFTYTTVSTGMFNSAKFVADMLVNAGIPAELAIVDDNNSIDKAISTFKPTHVFIEGYWVVPEKFEILQKLHPDVTFVVRCHSESPFLAQEGIAMGWTFGYLGQGVSVSGNSPRMNRELRVIAEAAGFDMMNLSKTIPLLPNYYPVGDVQVVNNQFTGTINVGCFGAIRPMKNHLLQAIAAIDYAESNNLKLRFHINGGRVEMNGGNPLKNLHALFANLPQHELVEHDWASHEDFLDLIKSMDICLQASFTETFNIVTADAVSQGVPVVVSSEISWVKPPFADPTSAKDIVAKMELALENRGRTVQNSVEGLKEHSAMAKKRWLKYLSVDAVDVAQPKTSVFQAFKSFLGLA